MNDPDSVKSKVLEWLNDSVGGTFSAACQHAGISRTLGYDWRKLDPDFDAKVKDAVARADANGGDFAETKLMQAINNSELTAVLFYLKTKHKARGYVERQEQTGADGKAQIMTVRWNDE